jgi:hypothetical protein
MSLPNGCKVWLALGADLTAAPSTWTWTDVSAFVLANQGGGVTVEIGYPDGSDEASPTRITFLANNADGRWAPTNPAGAWFGQIDIDTPVRVTFDAGSGNVVRGIAYLADLPLEWTAGGKYKTVQVEALGILSRLDSADALDSSARRRALGVGLINASPVAYWPFEDGSGATRAASAVAGQPDVTSFINVTFAGDSDVGGSKPLPTLVTLSGINITVAPYERPSPEAWGVMMAIKIPARPAVTQDFAVAVFCNTGTVRKWVPEISNATPAVLKLHGYNAAGTEVLADTGLAFNNIVNGSDREPFGEQLAFEITAQQSGADVEWFFRIWHGSNIGHTSTGTLVGATLGPVNQMATGTNTALDGATVGHYGVYTFSDGPGFGVATPAAFIAAGGLAETTTSRFSLQAFLNGVDNDVTGTSTTTMGYIPTDTLLNVLRECDRLERGLMWEAPAGTVNLRPRTDLVNQSVAMTIPYAQTRTLQPTSVVRDYVNRVTVARTGGSSATVDATGPLSPTNRGVVRSRQTTVNAEDDTNLRYYAQWDAAVGTMQDYRYAVELQFHGVAAGLLSTWLARGLGDRVQITGPPSWLPPDTIDGYLRGYSEHITRYEYTAALRLMPYRPYLAWTVEGSGNTGRADTSGSRLLAAITSSATTAIIGTYGNPGEKTGVAAKWSTTSLPYDLAVRGVERVTCTAVANNPPTFVAAGVAAHADNAALAPALPAGLTVGDLLLCAAVIRNTGAHVNDMTGWVRLPIFGAFENVALFGRQYVAGDSAPAVTFFNGSAGDSTSAQVCAFRYLQPVLHNRAVRALNTASLNMATPDLSILRNGCVAIAVAWMPDDWTSVTSPAGFTEIGEPDTTLGNDQGFSWAYQIQTTAAYVPTGTFTVTGGTSQISKVGLVALLGDVQTLTLTRNLNGISGGLGHPAGADVNLWRGGVVMRP